MKTQIQYKFEELTELLNLKTSSEMLKNRKISKNCYKNSYIIIDYVPQYGGYVLMIVLKSSGQSHFDQTQTTRLPKKEFLAYLTGLLSGLQSKTNLNIK